MSKANQTIQMIVGLGNPGPDYLNTRHNVGQWFIKSLATRYQAALKIESKFNGQVARINVSGKDVRLLIPSVYMNESGKAVAPLATFFKIAPENILVVHDELDLDPGTVRLKQGGGHGGHNGLRDIISCLGNNKDFMRLRIGVGHPGDKNKVTGYVLKNPGADDKIAIDNSIDEALDIIELVVAGKHQDAMTRLHTK